MTVADPTYPLYPIANILAALFLLLVLLTSIVRQTWNLGVAFLCFWLFFEDLGAGINAIIWANNADLKHYVYCDIYSHLELICTVVKPMSTLIISRRLYLLASMRSIEPPTKAAMLWDKGFEWTAGLIVPLLMAGPVYYTMQQSRFQVIQGTGCTNAISASILTDILFQPWDVIPPLLSVVLYYPRAVRLFYRQGKDVNRFLQSNGSVSRTSYIRLSILASIDLLLMLPIGIVNTFFTIQYDVVQTDDVAFYYGWNETHHYDWPPISTPYTELESISDVVQTYFADWTSPVLAFVIFGLFGVTAEARASYRKVFWIVVGWVGWRGKASHGQAPRSELGTIEFVTPVQEGTGIAECEVYDIADAGSKGDDASPDWQHHGHGEPNPFPAGIGYSKHRRSQSTVIIDVPTAAQGRTADPGHTKEKY